MGPSWGMHPLMLALCLAQAPAVHPGVPPALAALPIPEGFRLRMDNREYSDFDQVAFEVRPSVERGPVRLPMEGRVWKFTLESSGARVGASTMLQRLRPALEEAGWTWQWLERGVASRRSDGMDLWVRVTPGATGEVRVVLLERTDPPRLTLVPPGPEVQWPRPEQDFPYLTPWPGSRLVRSAPTQAPVAADLGNGAQGFVLVNFIEKEYALPGPVSAHAFTTAYRRALEAAGWEIEGNFKGSLVQVQAVYVREGRDIRATLRLVDDAMAISVADVGAQRPK